MRRQIKYDILPIEAQEMVNHMQKIFRKINIFKLFANCMAGETSLWTAFWVVYVLFGCIQLVIIECIFHYYLTGSFVTFEYHNQITDQFITMAFPYLFVSSMCVWTCGKNSWIEWNILSKCIVVIPLTLGAFHLTSLF